MMTRAFYFVLMSLFMSTLMFFGEAKHNTSNGGDEVYIVYMGASTSMEGASRTDHFHLLNQHMQRKNISVVQIYKNSFLGFAVRLSPIDAKLIAKMSGVVSVFPDSTTRLHTTRSWDFLASRSAFKKKNIDDDISIVSSRSVNVSDSCSGDSDIIIGIVDSGIWPHHPSFDDKHTGPIPKRWKGTCMIGKNPTSSFKCNRKVIGARFYDDPDKPDSITSAMDEDGHGTHVASTAAGMSVNEASYYGIANGVARGGSQSSRVAVYRVCKKDYCPDSSVLKAFDDAIADGVDVISASMGDKYESFFTDSMSIGAFHAIEKGVTVVNSVGNDGPDPGTIENYSPWILSVGSTTIDRDFQVDIVLGGRNEVIKGGGITFSGLNNSAVYRLVHGSSAGYEQRDLFNATHCIPGSLDKAKVKGRIILCDDDDLVGTRNKINAMIEQGVIGIIIISDYLRHVTRNFQITTAIAAVDTTDAAKIQSYINSTINPLATILTTEAILNYKPAPEVDLYSSRGPTPITKNLLKPDVAAPGVNILAAGSFNDTSDAYPGMDQQPLFVFMSGTSMACPHVSGVVATVKYWHQTWSPSAIKSAIMTTANPTNNYNAPITEFYTGSTATPYDIGSGEISLFSSWWPGLVYETEPIDYILFMCNLGYNTSMIKRISSTLPNNFSCPSNSSPDSISDLNYPSIAVSGLMPNAPKTVKRTVTNVGRVYSVYTVTVEAPAGVHVQVVPNKLYFTKNVKKLSFQVTFILTTSSREDLFGSITWLSSNFYIVRSPFVVSNA